MYIFLISCKYVSEVEERNTFRSTTRKVKAGTLQFQEGEHNSINNTKQLTGWFYVICFVYFNSMGMVISKNKFKQIHASRIYHGKWQNFPHGLQHLQLSSWSVFLFRCANHIEFLPKLIFQSKLCLICDMTMICSWLKLKNISFWFQFTSCSSGKETRYYSL